MTPINFALLWHQHQPFYYSQVQDQLLLPWVRLHATKDYLEMAQHLERFPAMRATINLVPSLIKQLKLYEADKTDLLSEIAAKQIVELNEAEKQYLLRECFHADRDKLIARSHRYLELLEKRTFHDQWTEQDYRDLLVHYHLAWTGAIERGRGIVRSLVSQDRHYSEEQKQQLLEAHADIIRHIMPLHKQLHDQGQVELSTSPMYHPILPLLCHTGSAHEAMPQLHLPHGALGNIMSANAQVTGAVLMHEGAFGRRPTGMWPSEGSISDQALNLITEHGFAWTASDEAVLFNSLNHRNNADLRNEYGVYEKYFPRRYCHKEQNLVVFFRDHRLSDKIGFDYQHWNAVDAVYDFIAHVEQIRNDILHTYGEETLSHACVTVILDGENCWEYYPNNGYDFLDEFYAALTSNPHIHPITFSDYVQGHTDAIRPIRHIVAGSWINGNFKIWIGHPEKNRAWELLAEAWKLEAGAPEVSFDTPLARAEGSDWFWWYGDDHQSSQKPIFDELFREHLRAVYEAHHLPIPPELFRPILQGGTSSASGYGAMHRVGS